MAPTTAPRTPGRLSVKAKDEHPQYGKRVVDQDGNLVGYVKQHTIETHVQAPYGNTSLGTTRHKVYRTFDVTGHRLSDHNQRGDAVEALGRNAHATGMYTAPDKPTSGRAAAGTAEGKLTAARLAVGDRIYVSPISGAPDTPRSGAPVTITAVHKTTGSRIRMTAQLDDGREISVMGSGGRTDRVGVSPSQTFHVAPAKPTTPSTPGSTPGTSPGSGFVAVRDLKQGMRVSPDGEPVTVDQLTYWTTGRITIYGTRDDGRSVQVDLPSNPDDTLPLLPGLDQASELPFGSHPQPNSKMRPTDQAGTDVEVRAAAGTVQGRIVGEVERQYSGAAGSGFWVVQHPDGSYQTYDKRIVHPLPDGTPRYTKGLPVGRRHGRRGDHVIVTLNDGTEVTGTVDAWGPSRLVLAGDDGRRHDLHQASYRSVHEARQDFSHRVDPSVPTEPVEPPPARFDETTPVRRTATAVTPKGVQVGDRVRVPRRGERGETAVDEQFQVVARIHKDPGSSGRYHFYDADGTEIAEVYTAGKIYRAPGLGSPAAPEPKTYPTDTGGRVTRGQAGEIMHGAGPAMSVKSKNPHPKWGKRVTRDGEDVGYVKEVFEGGGGRHYQAYDSSGNPAGHGHARRADAVQELTATPTRGQADHEAILRGTRRGGSVPPEVVAQLPPGWTAGMAEQLGPAGVLPWYEHLVQQRLGGGPLSARERQLVGDRFKGRSPVPDAVAHLRHNRETPDQNRIEIVERATGRSGNPHSAIIAVERLTPADWAAMDADQRNHTLIVLRDLARRDDGEVAGRARAEYQRLAGDPMPSAVREVFPDRSTTSEAGALLETARRRYASGEDPVEIADWLSGQADEFEQTPASELQIAGRVHFSPEDMPDVRRGDLYTLQQTAERLRGAPRREPAGLAGPTPTPARYRGGLTHHQVTAGPPEVNVRGDTTYVLAGPDGNRIGLLVRKPDGTAYLSVGPNNHTLAPTETRTERAAIAAGQRMAAASQTRSAIRKALREAGHAPSVESQPEVGPGVHSPGFNLTLRPDGSVQVERVGVGTLSEYAKLLADAGFAIRWDGGRLYVRPGRVG